MQWGEYCPPLVELPTQTWHWGVLVGRATCAKPKKSQLKLDGGPLMGWPVWDMDVERVCPAGAYATSDLWKFYNFKYLNKSEEHFQKL